MEKIKTIIRIFLPVLLGGIVGFLIRGRIDYEVINKPPLAPEGFIFPLVWTFLYLLMGISYAQLKKDNDEFDSNSKLYYFGLFVNLLWPVFFFYFHWRLFSCFWIFLLLIVVVIQFFQFKKENALSAYLLIPYLLWIIFASYLTLGVYLLNG